MSDRPSAFRRWFRERLAMYLAVAAGTAIGGVLRAGLSIASVHFLGSGIPWGTLTANVLGSFAIGLYAALTGTDGRLLVGARQRQFFMTGICGGFTTFSVFSLESVTFLTSGEHRLAAINVGGSVVAWLLAVAAGYALGARFNKLGGPVSPHVTRERMSDMQIPERAVALRIFIGEDDRDEGRPLYEAIVLKAREVHLAGATVLRGPLGYGHSSRLHTTKVLRLSEDLPLVIEIVDSEDKIESFLPKLDRLMTSGLITIENVRVLQYGKNGGDRGRGSPRDAAKRLAGRRERTLRLRLDPGRDMSFVRHRQPDVESAGNAEGLAELHRGFPAPGRSGNTGPCRVRRGAPFASGLSCARPLTGVPAPQ